MTMPTRPAPAPPALRGQNAAANANVSLQQLRLLQQQQQELNQRPQQYNVTVPKLTIKLPPPTKSSAAIETSVSASNDTINSNSLARKFPQARYTPATNWSDSPFDLLTDGETINSTVPSKGKKTAPPRPPPPKIKAKTRAPTPPVPQSTNILSNIFQRKKASKAITANTASRIYNSAAYGSTATLAQKPQQQQQSITLHTTSNWNAAWNTIPNLCPGSLNSTQQQEPQLISFDSPPSSPTFTQKSNSDCLSVDSFSSDSNFSSPNNGSVSQPESGFEDDFGAAGRSRPTTTSPLDPWETFGSTDVNTQNDYGSIGTAHVRNLNTINARIHNSQDNPLCNGKSLVPPTPALNMPTIIKPKLSQKPKAPNPPPIQKSNNSTPSTHGDDFTSPPSPPMPKYAPPPPPPTAAISNPTVSLLDVISGKADALLLGANNEIGATITSKQPYGIALYDFDSNEEGDLCFRENEKIYLLEEISADWYRGRTRAGCEGIFPINYIEIKIPLTAKAELSKNLSTVSSNNSTPTYSAYPSNVNHLQNVKCLYHFPAEVEGDLELKENDLVTILYRINEDWLFGESNGRQGQFPANFLEYVPTNVPTI
ncbi:SH3 domain-containing lethal (3) 05822 isoform 1-T4 [Glossina fuscipes fuscipes]